MVHSAIGSEVTITLNGDTRDVSATSTIASLLASLELNPRLVVVEHNREILRDRDAFTSVEISHGDTIEIVHFVGGG